MTFTDEQLAEMANGYPEEFSAREVALALELRELRANPHDGYHTMAELYDQRMLWNALAVYFLDSEEPGRVTKSWRHHDGEPCFGKTEPGERWFIVTIHLPDGRFEQVTQHYPERDWDLFDCPELPVAPHWDGHTPEQGNARIRRFLLGTA